MSLNQPLASLEVIASDSATVLVVQYGSGGFQVFSVPTDKISFRESVDVKEFANALEKNSKKKKKEKK